MLFDNYTIIDLTHTLIPNAPTWHNNPGFRFQNDEIVMMVNTGTHIDAPALFINGAETAAEIPLKQLLLPACVLDVSKKTDANYQIAAEDVHHYEASHGKIPPGSIAIGCTGWSARWPDSKKYRNADNSGRTHFPTFSFGAIELLFERKIAAIGIDTLALEPLFSTFPGHKLLLNGGKYIIENLANCQKLPPKGAYVITLPMKIPEASEAPARVIGLIPNKQE